MPAIQSELIQDVITAARKQEAAKRRPKTSPAFAGPKVQLSAAKPVPWPRETARGGAR